MVMLSILVANSSLLCSKELLLDFYVSSGKPLLGFYVSSDIRKGHHLFCKFFNYKMTMFLYIFCVANIYLLSRREVLLDFYACGGTEKHNLIIIFKVNVLNAKMVMF
jgi:hypothetical protein